MNIPRIRWQGPGRYRPFSGAVPRLRITALLALALRLLTPELSAQAMIEGSAVLTSQNGAISVVDESGQDRGLKPRTRLNPNNLQWTTEAKAQAFLAFSNGTAVGIGESTRLHFLSYEQKPFGPEKEGFNQEPSVSNLTLELESGEIALACQRLSPISEFRVRLPKGTLRIHRGIAHIRYDQIGLHIAMIEGNLTYYYPDGATREFVSAGAHIRISDASAERQQVAERRSLDELPAEAALLHKAAQHASQRVLFQANAEDVAPPEPIMVVSPEYYEQPTPRPYEFKD